jgi:hypothetical protein
MYNRKENFSFPYICINTCMKLEEIRRRTAYVPNAKPNVKAATRTWVRSMTGDFPLALTLTLKQTIVEQTPKGTIKRQITRHDCERIALKFQQKLNRAVFGRRLADKKGMTLKYLPVVEGERSGKHLHLHFAVGGLPSYVKFNQFNSLVTEAKQHVQHVDAQHKVDIADSGWLEYITKETAPTHSDNVLWTLVK